MNNTDILGQIATSLTKIFLHKTLRLRINYISQTINNDDNSNTKKKSWILIIQDLQLIVHVKKKYPYDLFLFQYL